MSRTDAAPKTGISRITLYRKLKDDKYYPMYKEIIPLKNFQKLDNEMQRKILIRYHDLFTIEEICEKWGWYKGNCRMLAKKPKNCPSRKNEEKETIRLPARNSSRCSISGKGDQTPPQQPSEPEVQS